jgi:hypothetical protein
VVVHEAGFVPPKASLARRIFNKLFKPDGKSVVSALANKHWNRAYGKKGFIQYQCVLPVRTSRKGYALIFDTLAKAKYNPFLAVMKKFGPEGDGILSFPKEGITLAIDLPRRNSALMPLLDKSSAT